MANINVIALGGLDEIHKNLYLIEVDAKLFIVDAGMYEPLTANFGIQHFVPKLDYIDQMRDRVKGIFLSQANKLELGAITEIMKIVPKAPIYGSKETVEFIKLLYKQADN
jgi:ribonuclease J